MSTLAPPVTHQADMVDLFYQSIANDRQLQTQYSNLLVAEYLPREVLASTMKGGKGNVAIGISKPRAGRFEWNNGGIAGQQHENIKIDILARVLEGQTDTAVDITKAIKRRIREILFSAQYLGVGWIVHNEIQDGTPSTPSKRIAYNLLVYDVMTTMG